MKKRYNGRRLFCLALVVSLLSGCAIPGLSGKNASPLDPDKPVTITVWNYYNGQQLSVFNDIVEKFNTTEGRKQGIVVESFSQGSVGDLMENVLDSARGEAGAEKMPNIFAAYADTAYAMDEMGLVVDLAPYLSEEELDLYVESYIEEGRFDGDGSLKIFPVVKSTEVLLINDTAWQEFSQATGASYEDFSTIEGLTKTAQAYYDWTDAKTPEVFNDGQAFFGRDAMANYMLIGAMQLGTELFTVKNGHMTLNFERETVKKLWDNYYIPYIKGHFKAVGRFRSDDIKTGDIIALVGSSSGATFFPKQVVVSDTESYDIKSKVFAAPQFENSPGVAVQQGAGMVVTKASEAEIYASVQFLKWMTQKERNIALSTGSGYIPVTKEANDMEVIRQGNPEMSPQMEAILTVAVDTVNNNRLYTPSIFPKGTEARDVLDSCLSDQAKADREQVEGALAQGKSITEALEPFLSEEYFETWYQQTQNKLKELEG